MRAQGRRSELCGQNPFQIETDSSLILVFVPILMQVGPEIAVLKTHVDQLSDWTPDVTAQIEKVLTQAALFSCLLSGLALIPLTIGFLKILFLMNCFGQPSVAVQADKHW